MRLVKQLYYNLEEIDLLQRMGYKVNGASPKKSEGHRRIRYPFSVDHVNCISIGEGTEFLPGARLNIYPDSTSNLPRITIGDRCYLGHRMSIFGESDVAIGNDVLCADDVTIDSGNHGISPEMNIPYMNQPLSRASVKIGNNCWLGEKVMICAGVTIGDGCVIGAMSVVTKNVPDYSIAVGNPAKVIKKYDFEKHDWIRTQ